MAEEILIKFLLIVTLLFFIPKAVYYKSKIPYPLTEVILGIVLGILLPSYFFTDDIIRLLAMLGVITIFVNAGMEIDEKFISRNRKIIAENILLQLVLVIVVAVLLSASLSLPYQMGFLLSLALLIPSAGYIFSFLRSAKIGEKTRKWTEGKVISNEVFGIFLLLIFLNIDTPLKIFISLIVIGLIILLLPKILDIFYKKIFGKLIGAEFTFIFVVALISAYLTDIIGVHFIIGAFIAGLVSKRFLDEIKLKRFITKSKNRQITEGFSLFAMVFAPFYFFSVGLMLHADMLTYITFILASIFLIGITFARFIVLITHRRKTLKEQYKTSFDVTAMSMPTLLFTFVIAQILKTSFGLSDIIFGALLLYGLLTAAIPVILIKKRHK